MPPLSKQQVYLKKHNQNVHKVVTLLETESTDSDENSVLWYTKELDNNKILLELKEDIK
ncbi:6937_t:CDS:2 [Funneliformis caledonium]|uniref:6937_t:CDS:1 n=1 Tax=Funneliformis caledonium TaxID=1117310 RepID=A0A9N9C537_9GLOM|nr:6937_t:CDS:2 [Funneliformis caledonium]